MTAIATVCIYISYLAFVVVLCPQYYCSMLISKMGGQWEIDKIRLD